MRTLVLLACLTAVAAVARADFNVLTHVPEDTILIGRLQVDKALKSDLASQILVEKGAKYDQLRQWLDLAGGIDIDTVTRVWFLAARKDTGVALLEGDFDPALMRERVGKQPQMTLAKEPGTQLVVRFRNDKGKPTLVALLDPHTLLAGDEPWSQKYLDACNGKQRMLPASDPTLRRFASDSSMLLASLRGDLAKWGDFNADALRIVRQAWLRGELGTDLSLNLEILAKDEPNAEGLMHLLIGLACLKTEDPDLQGRPLLRQALTQIKVDRQDSTVHVSTQLQGAQLLQVVLNRR